MPLHAAHEMSVAAIPTAAVSTVCATVSTDRKRAAHLYDRSVTGHKGEPPLQSKEFGSYLTAPYPEYRAAGMNVPDGMSAVPSVKGSSLSSAGSSKYVNEEMSARDVPQKKICQSRSEALANQ